MFNTAGRDSPRCCFPNCSEHRPHKPFLEERWKRFKEGAVTARHKESRIRADDWTSRDRHDRVELNRL